MLIATALSVSPAAAQTVFGGVRGAVTDSRGAVGGATVSLVGTAFSATTDARGLYVIDHVPVGTYTVRAVRAGGAAIERPAVLVPGGTVVTVHARYDEGAAAPDSATPEPSARGRLSGELLARLPVDDARQALALAPGAVLRGTGIGIAGAPDLWIRGSAADQTAVFVDGAPARFETLGTQALALSASAISDVAVRAGVHAAEIADARGATIAYVTRSGGSRLGGSFAVGSEGPFGHGSTVEYNRFEGAVGGPIPRVPRLTWYVSASAQGQPSVYRGVGAEDVPTYTLAGVDTVVEYTPASGQTAVATLPRFAQVSGRCGETGNANTQVGRDIQANYGYGCLGLRRPLDWSTSLRGQAKLAFSYGHGSSVSLTGVGSDLQRRFFPGADIGAPLLYRGARTRSRLAVLNWSHTLGRPALGSVTIAANLSYGSDEYLAGPLDVGSQAATASPAFGIEFRTLGFTGLDVLPFPITDAIIRNIRVNGGLRVPYLDRYDLRSYQAFRTNPYGLAWGWPTAGLGGRLTLVQERRLNGRWLVEWQASPSLRVTGGADLARTDFSLYNGDLFSQADLEASRARPRRFGLFASGRAELGALVVDAGVRVDRVNAGGEFPRAPGRIFTNPDWGVGPAADDTAYANAVARVFEPGRSRRVVSPRLRAAWRVGPRTAMRVGVGQQLELPRYGAWFAHVNSDLAYTGLGVGFGQDVDLVKATLIEASVHHAFARHVVVDVSVYDKANAVPYAFRLRPVYDPFRGETGMVGVLSTEGGRATGADVGLQWSVGDALLGSVAYSVVRTSSSASEGEIVPEAASTHAIAGTVALRVPDAWGAGSVIGTVLRGASADFVFRITSGVPFTRVVNEGTGVVAPGTGGGMWLETLGHSQLPWSKVVDLRLAKAFATGGVGWTVYLEVRNVLGTRNLVGAFAETGTDANDLHRSLVLAPVITSLRLEPPSGAIAADGAIDLSQACSAWRSPVNCVALRRVEDRFGDGDGLYTAAEQVRALHAYYDAFFGAWRFHGPGRTARAGLEFRF